MKTPLCFLFVCFLGTLGLHAQAARDRTLAWWRLDTFVGDIAPARGGPDLRLWLERPTLVEPVSKEAPPRALYASRVIPAAGSLELALLYGGGAGALQQKELWDAAWPREGLTVEGFFRNTDEGLRGRRAIVSCGDGRNDAAWTVAIENGNLSFSVFRDGDSDPTYALSIPRDTRNGKWHYFVVQVRPDAARKTQTIHLLLKPEGAESLSNRQELPADFVARAHQKGLIVGRSSVFYDTKPEYRGTLDTFRGHLADIRISSAPLEADKLLGVTR